MRPTREGHGGAGRTGLIYKGIGIDPEAPVDDPPEPTDQAPGGLAFVPYLVTGSAALVQSKTGVQLGGGSPITVTLDASPTVGNILVLCISDDDDDGPTFSIDNGTWTQVTPTVYSGNGTNWPNRMYYQVVTGSTSAATNIDSSGGATDTGHLKVAVLELSGVDDHDATADQSNTATTSESVTPTAGLPAVAVSATFGRNSSGSPLAPAGGMTELAELVDGGGNRPYGINYQEIAATAGSYTLGSTGAAANSSMIGAIFTDTGESLVWIDAPLTVDSSDSTYDYAYDTGTEVFWRIDLGDTYLVDSIRARLAYETAGSNPLIVQAGNESDYSDVVTIDTIAVTATGTFTAQDVTGSWTPTAAYRYWQLVQTTEDDIRIHTVELFTSPEEGVTDHPELTGRSTADSHPASAVTFTSYSTIAATNVQDAIEELLDEAAAATYYAPPTITNYAAQFAAGSTTCAVTVTAPATTDKLVAIVYSTGRGANSITHTNVTWTQRYTGNGNSQYLEVWTGVAAASAGTTATANFTGSNNQYVEIFTVNSAASAFTAASAVSTGTAATTALATVSGSTTVGNHYIIATSANSPSTSISAASQGYAYLTAFGGIARSGILRSNVARLSYWSESSSAVNYFTAIISLT